MFQITLDTARKAFNDIKPVSGKGERKSRNALQKICDQIYSHIKEEYGRNIDRKKELVEQAKSLVEHEDLRSPWRFWPTSSRRPRTRKRGWLTR